MRFFQDNKQSKFKSAILRVIVAFLVYFVSLLGIGVILSRVPTPDVLTLLPNQVPQLFAIALVLAVLTKRFETNLSNYGLNIDTRWGLDAVVGVMVGVIFQGISTVALIYVGDATVAESWTTGVFDSRGAVVLAVSSTVVGYAVVAVGEDLMFRGVLIRELAESAKSFDFSGQTSTIIAIIISSILFGLLHIGAGADGLSTEVVVLQALVAGIYFGIAYTITDSLAIPIGIHLSTNVWTTLVFGTSGSGYPMAFAFERSVQLEPTLLITLFLPAGVLVGLVLLWVQFVGEDSLDISLSCL